MDYKKHQNDSAKKIRFYKDFFFEEPKALGNAAKTSETK